MQSEPNTLPADPLYSFRSSVALVFADSYSARLARALENSSRNAQKWVNDQEPAPRHAVEFIDAQLVIVNELKPRERIEALVAELSSLHPEVVASYLSAAYENLSGKPIR